MLSSPDKSSPDQRSTALPQDAVVAEKRDAVLAQWSSAKELLKKRREQLEAALHFQHYLRDVKELETWMQQRMQIASDEAYKDPTNLKRKIKQHKEFEQEVLANRHVVSSLEEAGEAMITEGHFASPQVKETIASFKGQWQALLDKSNEKAQKLVQADQLVEFNRDADETDSWLNEKIQVAKAEEIGEDVEHCELLQHRFEEFLKDLKANESRVQNSRATCEGLRSAHHPDMAVIDARTKDLEASWENLQALSAQRKKNLENAHEIHVFVRDCDETKGRILEKDMTLPNEVGKDLSSVEALQRKHEGLIRDLQAINEIVKAHETEAARLTKAYPTHTPTVQAKKEELQRHWAQLQEKTSSRRSTLDDSHDLQGYLNDHRNAVSWLLDMKGQIEAENIDAVQDVFGAKSLCVRHQERRGEINARQESFDKVQKFGDSLIARNHFASSDLKEKNQELAALRQELNALCEKRAKEFDQCQDLHSYQRGAETILAWIAAREASIASRQFGDSIEATERLLKRHDDFERSLAAYQDNINTFETVAKRLIGYDHYAKDAISATLDKVLSNRKTLEENTQSRRKFLEESLQFHQHVRDLDEETTWIDEQLLIASDESYKEPTNLQGKIKQHSTFQQEVGANKDAIAKLQSQNKAMVDASHHRQDDLTAAIGALLDKWNSLLAKSAEKALKLHETKQWVDFTREADEIHAWLENKISIASSEEIGKDVEHCEQLRLKFEEFSKEVSSYTSKIDQIRKFSQVILDEKHPRASEVASRTQAISDSWTRLKELTAKRQTLLSRAAEIHVFIRDADETNARMQDKDAMAASEDYGKDLSSVEVAKRKHDALLRDLIAVGESMAAHVAEADRLIKAYPEMNAPVVAKKADIEQHWESLQAKSALRKKKLEESHNLQRFLYDFRNAIGWMLDMKDSIESDDPGSVQDVAGAQALLDHHQERKAEIEARQSTFDKVRQNGEELLSKNNYGSDQIAQKVEELANERASLRALWAKFDIIFEEYRDHHLFNREATETESWINQNIQVAQNNNLGSSIDDVEAMLKKFDDFEKSIMAQEEKAVKIDTLAASLLAKRNQNKAKEQASSTQSSA